MGSSAGDNILEPTATERIMSRHHANRSRAQHRDAAPLSIERIIASDTGAGDAESLKAPSGGWWCSRDKEDLPTLELVLRPEVPFTLTKLLVMAENENCPKDVEVSLTGADAPPSHSLAQRVKVPDWERTAASPIEPAIRVPAGEVRVLLRLMSNNGDWYHGINILRLFGEEIPNEPAFLRRMDTIRMDISPPAQKSGCAMQ